jgi:hypothetical protein
MLEDKLTSFQKTLRKGLISLVGITSLLITPSLLNADDPASPKPFTTVSEEEPPREVYLEILKKYLGTKYLAVEKNPIKKEVWDNKWKKEATKKEIGNAILLYVPNKKRPNKLINTQFKKVDPNYLNLMINNYFVWMNPKDLTANEKIMFLKSYRDYQQINNYLSPKKRK